MTVQNNKKYISNLQIFEMNKKGINMLTLFVFIDVLFPNATQKPIQFSKKTEAVSN